MSTDPFSNLPDDRRVPMETLRDLVRKNLPPGYEEGFDFGMVVWQVPPSVYPDTYNKKPLMYAAMASQKNHMALYLCNAYGIPELRARFEARCAASGKKVDMGKSCLRFSRLEQLDLEAVAEIIAATPMEDYVAFTRNVHSATKTGQKKAAKQAKA